MSDPRKPKDYDKKSIVLRARGWYDWYHPDYWCNDKLCPVDRDPTYHGVTLNVAYMMEFEQDMKDIINE